MLLIYKGFCGPGVPSCNPLIYMELRNPLIYKGFCGPT